MHRLPVPMCNSLLNVARNIRQHKERQDNFRLKDQRYEKHKKDEFGLQANMEKASEEHIEILFRWEKCLNGEF